MIFFLPESPVIADSLTACAGLTPLYGKGFYFPESAVSADSLTLFLQPSAQSLALRSVCMLKIPSIAKQTIAWTHENATNTSQPLKTEYSCLENIADQAAEEFKMVTYSFCHSKSGCTTTV